MRHVYAFNSIVDAFKMMLNSNKDVMRVVGPAPMGGDYIEIIVDEPPLRKAMLRYSVDLLLISLLISGITAALVYLALHYLFVRPMRRMTANMTAFRADPEDPGSIIVPSGAHRRDRHRRTRACRHAAELASMLQQKSRLAALGLAVSKINHDLRNLLASAQLFSDRLSSLPDPNVQRFAPKLDACARARHRLLPIDLVLRPRCRSRRRIASRSLLEPLVEEVRETLGLGPECPIRWISAVERGLVVEADPDQLFRILLNLARNAAQALESRAPGDPGRDQIRITGRREGAVVVIEVSDTGPGFSGRRRRICSKPSRARPAPAARGSGSSSPQSWCARMAAKSAWWKARSARPCG